eukprot:TRINITY_DN53858_c0_g1_i1.p1 TRINITY_DN53858_c0_g1~~TRINITY_DN53858_c0_g1_i1.p1  ORF type:complete len:193 (-),score=57.40 TRINITY_DN53858_c0_g1_i1:112-669(-)
MAGASAAETCVPSAGAEVQQSQLRALLAEVLEAFRADAGELQERLQGHEDMLRSQQRVRTQEIMHLQWDLARRREELAKRCEKIRKQLAGQAPRTPCSTEAAKPVAVACAPQVKNEAPALAQEIRLDDANEADADNADAGAPDAQDHWFHDSGPFQQVSSTPSSPTRVLATPETAPKKVPREIEV